MSAMRRSIAVLVIALAGASLGSSCTLLQQRTSGGGGFIEPIAIPTSTEKPAAEEIVFTELRDNGSCLYVVTIENNRQGSDVLPIWPTGFHAKVGPTARYLYSDTNQEIPFVVDSERLELHGQYLDSAPEDAVIPPGCVGLRLFLVGTAFNRS
jgi:hypothetical protein